MYIYKLIPPPLILIYINSYHLLSLGMSVWSISLQHQQISNRITTQQPILALVLVMCAVPTNLRAGVHIFIHIQACNKGIRGFHEHLVTFRYSKLLDFYGLKR